jgi:hypothetical protein
MSVRQGQWIALGRPQTAADSGQVLPHRTILPGAARREISEKRYLSGLQVSA